MTDPQQTSARLEAELEARLLRELASEWRAINLARFRGALRTPVIGLADADAPLASFDPKLRALTVSRRLALEFAWADVVESLARLAVEQFVAERLRVDEHRRGPSYRRICRRLGVHPVPLDARLVAPEPAGVRPDASAKLLARVRKLLALAGSPNRHEAETAALTAQRLIIKFNLDRAESIPEADEDRREYGFRQLGPALARLHEHDHRLAKLLAAHFFVETAWAPIYLPRAGVRATVLEVCGLALNLDMAAHVYAFLRATARRLWVADAAARGHEHAGERAAFLAGVMQGFEAKLDAQREQLAEQGLVWVPAPGLGEYFRLRNPRLRHGVAAGAGGSASEAFERGHAAGRRIVLSTPVTTGSKSGGPAKALGVGRTT